MLSPPHVFNVARITCVARFVRVARLVHVARLIDFRDWIAGRVFATNFALILLRIFRVGFSATLFEGRMLTQ